VGSLSLGDRRWRVRGSLPPLSQGPRAALLHGIERWSPLPPPRDEALRVRLLLRGAHRKSSMRVGTLTTLAGRSRGPAARGLRGVSRPKRRPSVRKAAHSQGSPGTRGHGAADPSSLAQASAPASRPARRRPDAPGSWTSRSRGCQQRRRGERGVPQGCSSAQVKLPNKAKPRTLPSALSDTYLDTTARSTSHSSTRVGTLTSLAGRSRGPAAQGLRGVARPKKRPSTWRRAYPRGSPDARPP
jgi:hypothetical protein